MKLKKIAEALQDVLQKKVSGHPKRREALKELVEKLEGKETKVRRKLKKADDAQERAKYERKLKIVQAQREKGEEALKQED